ncbi:hypothetical protein M409DRAFT_27112 [Zasmidium cellare ATCC 36951]|uniref:Peptidase C14 caspase domain-containing protein n=1 Tax=Zasmidium cellare ATCC 36951 TaxID=1080233 RepID=A0A6A6CA14_ZASCE|nr:uncharacterized protein M409DRAFT_27112 [Zasmidium cellare ATCC 36951]KAF2162489.1 hypothetical protein M409DRAFT_27112 [Zasmidium cellare ATCC 36951]
MSQPLPQPISPDGPRSHSTNDHVNGIADGLASLETDQRDLKGKWTKLMGQPKPVMHKKASVLMLYWDPAYTSLRGVRALREVFETRYNFKVVEGMIDTKDKYPQIQAFQHVSNFVASEDSENGLLLVYYAGHGHTEAASLGRITLSGAYTEDESEKKFASIEWSSVELVLSKTKSDVLEIFDCCHAGLLCTQAEFRSFTRCFEILAACAHNQRTPAPGPNSFTTALIRALKELACREGFSTDQLYSKLKEYDVFDNTRMPELYQSRFLPPSGFEIAPDPLHLAPISKSGNDTSGTFRSDRNKEVENEQLLHLRFHYRTEVSDADLEQLARVLNNQVVNSKRIKAHRVTALGKYNIATYDLTTRNMMKRFGTTWMTRARQKSNAFQRPEIDLQDPIVHPAGPCCTSDVDDARSF